MEIESANVAHETTLSSDSETSPSANLLPPQYRPLIINVIGPHPDERWKAGEFRKAYALKHGATGNSRSDWSEVQRYGVSRHRVNECYSVDGDPLADLRDLLGLLAEQPTLAIVLGSLKDDSREDRDGDGYLVRARDGQHYADAPTRIFPVDVDGLDCDDVHEAGDAIDDFISKHMPELEGCAYVWHHTGSSGIKCVRVRLWFLLAEPRHLAAMRAYVATVNERARDEVVDASLYTASHLVFTSAPLLTAADGKPLPPRAPAGVWHVAGDLVPADAFADVSPDAVAVSGASAHARPVSGKLTKLAAGEMLGSMGPGNYAVPIHKLLCSAAWNTTDARSDFDFGAFVATIEQRVRETSEPVELDRRLRDHVNERRLLQAWEKARDRKRRELEQMASSPVVDAVLPALGKLRISTAGVGALDELTPAERAALRSECGEDDAPMAIADVRRKFSADFADLSDRLLFSGELGHWLITLPAGAGKTKLLEYLTRPGIVSSCRIRIYVPSHRLAHQLVADLQVAASAHRADPRLYGDLPALIRHHKGRSQPGMCIDDASRPKAERAEKLGVSAKKNVCGGCASKDVCPWLRQAKDDGCGIVVTTHAAAVTEQRGDDVDLVIVDESIAANFIESDETTLAALGNIGRLRSRMGDISFATADLRACRGRLEAALRAAVPAELDKPALLPTAGWESFDFDMALGLESELRDTLATQIINREDAGGNAADWRAQLAASKHAAALYSAIAASTKCQRQAVTGMYVFASLGDVSEPLVRYATLSGEASRVYGEASITLDGTADESVWRALVSRDGAAVPGGVLGANIAVPDGVRAFQYVDKAGSRSSLLPDLRETPAEKKRKTARDGIVGARHWARDLLGGDQYDTDVAKSEAEVAADDAARATRKQRSDANVDLIERAAAFLAADAGRTVDINGKPVSVLLVAQKAVAAHLQQRVPAGVAVEHFGVLRGLNAYSKVPVAVIVGRVRPSNIDLELLTGALHSRNPAVQKIDHYDVAPAEGRPWLEQHPNALVAALQWQITTAGVQQAVARVRVYDRSPADPVDIHVFGQCDVGLPATLVRRLSWDDAKRTPVEVALARGCVFADMRLNQRAYPGWFPRGAKDGFGRSDREGRAKFNELLGNLARHLESRLEPYSEVGGPNSDPLLAVETGFEEQQQLVSADALDYSSNGSEHHCQRRHRLVKVRVAGAGKSCLALVDVKLGRDDVARLVGAPVDAWIEQDADKVQAVAAGLMVGRVDSR